ncbi:MAG: flagellar basal body P-ring protein FlgI [Alphaproteobacteria bacterium]|nr:flagellar basal body P-ring protein FlgI [Alphaproteobacteria bacterium]
MRPNMKNFITNIQKSFAFLTAAAVLMFSSQAFASSRIKDISDIEGVRENYLIGYGLVVGLNGTGDSISSMAFTEESLIGMLERLGVNTRDGKIKTKNVAAVMVTGSLPAFARQGTRIDVSISALGDAKSLQGGTLLVTPMLGADGEVYAIAQGQVAIAGFSAQGDAQSIVKGVPTSGRIANGGIIEREILFDFANQKSIKLALRNPDFTTASRIADAINSYLGSVAATTIDSGTVVLNLGRTRREELIQVLTDIEQLRIQPDQVAKVIIDEKSGIIVIGENVRINPIAIAQGNLTIRITETPQVSQPAPFSTTGQTVTVPRTDIQVDEQSGNKLNILKSGVSLQELVDGLNALGVGPRDMISILQAVKAAGALQAEIEVM